MKLVVLLLFLGISSISFADGFTVGEKIICTELKDQRVLTIQILDPARQMASMRYTVGENKLFNGEGAYAYSGAGIDFALVSAGRPIITTLVSSDLTYAHVPRNGVRLDCRIE